MGGRRWLTNHRICIPPTTAAVWYHQQPQRRKLPLTTIGYYYLATYSVPMESGTRNGVDKGDRELGSLPDHLSPELEI